MATTFFRNTGARHFALCLGLLLLAGALPPLSAAERSEIDPWESLLKPAYFKGVEFVEDGSVMEMETPYRAEDAAFTPVRLKALIPQTPERYIQTLYMFVDKNPQPLVGVFHLSPEMGRADLAMRIRIDQYTNIRAVAVLNTGEHFLSTNFVKAQGGCSAPPASDIKAAMARIGKMKFRTIGESEDDLMVGQFNVSHPNLTGMQLDQRTRAYIPEHYVKSVKISYNGKPIMLAETGFSISADPSFRFFFQPSEGGELTAEVIDSKGNDWTHSFPVEL